MRQFITAFYSLPGRPRFHNNSPWHLQWSTSAPSSPSVRFSDPRAFELILIAVVQLDSSQPQHSSTGPRVPAHSEKLASYQKPLALLPAGEYRNKLWLQTLTSRVLAFILWCVCQVAWPAAPPPGDARGAPFGHIPCLEASGWKRTPRSSSLSLQTLT